MYLPGEALPTVQIETLKIDRQTNRFSAIVVGAGGKHRGSRITVNGKYYRIIDVPVLVRRMSSKEIIGANDIRLVNRRADKVDMNALRDVSELIGMSPVRTLSAERPVKRGEIRLCPGRERVDRDHDLPHGPDDIIGARQGAQDGSKGNTIRVLNAKTHKVIDGTVVNSGTVTVSPLSRLASGRSSR